jgi:hypothetical protein
MSEHERMLVQLGRLLSEVARPYKWDDVLPDEVRARLWQLGVPCNDLTPREVVIASLWQRKRTLLTAMRPGWGGPGVTPPSAA